MADPRTTAAVGTASIVRFLLNLSAVMCLVTALLFRFFADRPLEWWQALALYGVSTVLAWFGTRRRSDNAVPMSELGKSHVTPFQALIVTLVVVAISFFIAWIIVQYETAGQR